VKTTIEIPRKAPNLAVWSWLVLERDNYTCQNCGFSSDKHLLHAHHIDDEPKFRLRINNGITLCKDCHLKTFKRGSGSYWRSKQSEPFGGRFVFPCEVEVNKRLLAEVTEEG